MPARSLNGELGTARLKRWQLVNGREHGEQTSARFAWDGLDSAAVHTMLSVSEWPCDGDEPRWLGTLRAVDAYARAWAEHGSTAPSMFASADDPPLPFEDLWAPVLAFALERLASRCFGAIDRRLSTAGVAGLTRGLCRRLADMASATLQEEFAAFRPVGCGLLAPLLGNDEIPSSDQHYRRFVVHHVGTGLADLFGCYPVLARLVAETVDLWLVATAEFVDRLDQDHDALEAAFAGGAPLGKVVRTRSLLGDPHDSGRSVSSATFESGLELLYKPKPLAIDCAYAALLEWCNARCPAPGLLVHRTLSRGPYGWAEWVGQCECGDVAEVELYFERAGMLLRLLHVLGATDGHEDNLVAHGANPVVVDLETVVHAEYGGSDSRFREQAEYGLDFRVILDSVLRVGLLPEWGWEERDPSRAFDMSGLGGGGADRQLVRRWRFVNTDLMHASFAEERRPPGRNVVRLRGVRVVVGDYSDSVVAGFRRMDALLREHSEELLSSDGPLAGFAGCRARYLFRSTSSYRNLLEASWAPRLLRDAVERGIEIETLARAVAEEGSARPRQWPIFESERRGIERNDIPSFWTVVDGADLHDADGLVAGGFFRQKSSERIRERVRELSARQCELQVAIVRGSLLAQLAAPPTIGCSIEFDDAPRESVALPSSTAGLLDLAVELGDRLARQAVPLGPGAGSVWMTLAYIPEVAKLQFQFEPMTAELYQGATGIAMFFAALARVTGDEGAASTALEAVRPLRRFLRVARGGEGEWLVRRIGIGGMSGIGSVIYALCRIDELLPGHDLVADALALATMLTPEALAKDLHFDVMNGVAGAMLGLLALYRASANESVLERAIQCGEHLLQHRVSVDGKPPAWVGDSAVPLTGFSHGAAGIAYALFRLHEESGDARVRVAAQDAIAYERTAFCPERSNWADFRLATCGDGSHRCSLGWCHGAPGIGLARLGIPEAVADSEVAREIDAAVHATRSHLQQELDTLCCGNFGRIETLLVAGQRLQRPDLIDAAVTGAAEAVARAGRRGGFHLFPELPVGVGNPSLFRGEAGIGYQLLRLARPSELPSVMLLQ